MWNMFKVNNNDTRTTPCARVSFLWCRSGIFIVNFEYISHLVVCPFFAAPVIKDYTEKRR